MRRLKILAWVGVGVIALGLPLSFYSSVLATRGDLGSYNGYWIAYTISILGVVLMVMGGVITRPRFYWLAAIIIGIAYIASLYGWLGNNSAGFTGMIMVILPGLAAILVGLFVYRLSGRRKKKGNEKRRS